MAKQTVPLFAAYAKSAPLLDLEFYLADGYCDRMAAGHGPRAGEALRALYALRDELRAKKQESRDKRRVWAAIETLRSRCPRVYRNDWIDDVLEANELEEVA